MLLFARPERERVYAEPAQRGPGSFFHTTAGLLGLAEIEARLQAEQVYWSPAHARRDKARPGRGMPREAA
ncbi:SIS family regulator [Bordetella pertussis]|nr:SIS family regulator [Bordetella pertussis]